MFRIAKYFLFFPPFLLGLKAFADIPKDQCFTKDYSARFGPVRDQDGHGYCRAFSAAALAEEARCKKNSSKCGQSVSALDISRCNWRLTEINEGQLGGDDLECAVKHGVCMEKDAPYDGLTSFKCSLWNVIMGDGIRCKNEKLAQLYWDWKKANLACTKNKNMALSQAAQELQNFKKELLYRSLRELVPEEMLIGKEISQLFSGSYSGSDFLRQVLITKSCEEHREKIPGSLVTDYFPIKSEKNYRPAALNFIREGLNKNSSVAITLDLSQTSLGQQRGVYANYRDHSLVITGMRYNSKLERCEFQLRNSWGEDADFHGWTAVDDISAAISAVGYLL